MIKRLKAEIIITDTLPLKLLDTTLPDKILFVDILGSIQLLSFDKDLVLPPEPLVPDFPPVVGDIYHSEPEENIVWMLNGRGFYGLDTRQKEDRHYITAVDGNLKVLNSFLADNMDKTFLFELTVIPHDAFYYILYNFFNNEIIYESDLYIGKICPFQKNLLLNEYIKKEGSTLYNWHLLTLKGKTLDKHPLPHILTKYQINIWERSRTIHPQKRILLGTSKISGTLQYFSVRWDEEYEEIKAEPLLFQVPKKSILSSKFEFSPDGNWVKTLKYVTGFPPELVIFHVNDAYPQGISLPILCGYTKEMNSGAFMTHSEWGPCYVEMDVDAKGKLFIFKLNDGLKILAEQIVR